MSMLTFESFSPDDVNAVIIALAQATHQADKTAVYCLEIVGDLENYERDILVMGSPFQLRNQYDRYIWINDQLREENFACGTVISCQKLQSGVFHYRGNVGKVLKMNQVIPKLQFGDRGYNGVAYRGIEDAFPDAVIAERGIYQDAGFGLDPAAICALISVKSAKISDGRIYFKTYLDEEANLKNNCLNSKQLLRTIDEVHLPVQVPLSDSDVGSVILVSFGAQRATGRYEKEQAVCEGIFTGSKPNVISHTHTHNEPVKITDGSGQFIDVPGEVVVDTGNDAGTGISLELFYKLNLQPTSRHLSRTVFVNVGGGNMEKFSTVPLEVEVKGHKFSVDALIGAPARGTDLLIGNDLINQLIEKGFTIGEW